MQSNADLFIDVCALRVVFNRDVTVTPRESWIQVNLGRGNLLFVEVFANSVE